MPLDGDAVKELMRRQDRIFKARDRLHKEVGRVVIVISELESALALLLIVASAPVKTKKCLELFHSQQSFEKKLRLTDFVIDLSATKAEAKEWHKIHSEIGKNKDIRNSAAHQHSWIFEDDEAGVVRAFLGPVAGLSEKKGKEINAEDLEDASASITKVREKVSKLTFDMAERKNLISEEPEDD
ncbi:hypothetical protein [Methylorubrum thiocyanatum]|uniref:hypothetical protein n=1 Tax=Methylorubrum thiocyanatum TaxID=47958 RepID=UPI003657D18E